MQVLTDIDRPPQNLPTLGRYVKRHQDLLGLCHKLLGICPPHLYASRLRIDKSGTAFWGLLHVDPYEVVFTGYYYSCAESGMDVRKASNVREVGFGKKVDDAPHRSYEPHTIASERAQLVEHELT